MCYCSIFNLYIKLVIVNVTNAIHEVVDMNMSELALLENYLIKLQLK